MNKKEKEEKVAKFEKYILTEQIAQVAETIAFEASNLLYNEINEHIFDRDLAKESDDKTYQKIYKEIYNKVIWKLVK
tara:strand:- start:250 stop:480 length:231 start_codon:yes stop_codon:yes gene_type:complete